MHGISVMWVAIFVGFVLFWSGLALYWGFGLAKENQRQNDHVKRFLHDADVNDAADMETDSECVQLSVPRPQAGDWLMGPFGIREVTEEDLRDEGTRQ